MIAPLPALLGRARVVRVAAQPILDDVMIELLRPEHSRKTLTHYVLRVCREIPRNDRCVKFIGLASPERECCVEVVKRVRSSEVRVGKSHPYHDRLTRTERQFVMGGCFGANMFGVDRFLGTLHDMVVDPVFDEASEILNSK